MRKEATFLATRLAWLVGVLLAYLPPAPVAAQYYLPGQPPSGTGIVHTTERPPSPAERTWLGIRERANLEMVSYSDIDIYVDENEVQTEVWDYLGPVYWYHDGDGELYVNGNSGTYIAPDDAYNSPERVWIVVHDSGTMGIDPTCSDEVSFDIYEPSGAVAYPSESYELGTPGSPENSMGVATLFYFQTLPNTVNFYNASLREKIEPQEFSWPNGSSYRVPDQYPQAFTKAIQVLDFSDSPNWYGDLVITGGPWNVDRLIDTGSQVHVDCQFNVVQLLQFYGYYSWNTYANPMHLRKFSASTFGARVWWDAAWGDEKGPYQEQGQ